MAWRHKLAQLVFIFIAVLIVQGIILPPLANAAALPKSAFIAGVVGRPQSFVLSCEFALGGGFGRLLGDIYFRERVSI